MLTFFSMVFFVLGIILGMFIQYTAPGAFTGVVAIFKAIGNLFKKKS